MTTSVGGMGQRGQGELRVGDRTELGGVVAAEFRLVRIDMNEPRRRDRERVPSVPGTGIRFRQPGADGDDEIGGPAFLVGDRRTPETSLPKQQRVVIAQTAF